MAGIKAQSSGLTCAGLFAGVGGIELGLEHAGFETRFLCEWLPEARAVLERRFINAELCEDVNALVANPRYRLPDVDLVSAGFPCQDLSQCGRTAGIRGERSGLVDALLELLSRRKRGPRWLLLENVPFMLRLDRGLAMTHLTGCLEQLGFAWAYRVVDARSFGLPQRRERVVLLASRTEDPRSILFADEAGSNAPEEAEDDRPCGFYWTEGNRGLGWAYDSVPTLKAGSTVGIPSPPAIWLPAYDRFVAPRIDDAEAMQGFPRDWTSFAHTRPRLHDRLRWRLVGNAVPVPIAKWVGERIQRAGSFAASESRRLHPSEAWPTAAWGSAGARFVVDRSTWPVSTRWSGLAARYGADGRRLLDRPGLSARAASGFLGRIKRSPLRRGRDSRFTGALERFIETIDREAA